MNSIYIHIPFCRSTCWYCSFASVAGLESLYGRYSNAVCLEVEQNAASRFNRDNGPSPVTTLFIGGGTPTVLTLEQLTAILNCCREQFTFEVDAEISLEANPDTVSLAYLRGLKVAGFNRISFGVQSFIDDELKVLGRIHDARRAERAVLDARAAGFDNLSLDLMYGLPGQTPATWRESLERAMSLAPEHLSAYQLSIEEGTHFADLAGRGELQTPPEEHIVEMDAITTAITKEAGFDQYEISNYARPGRTCRHNIVYWHNDEYGGFGAGAVSYRDGVRSARIKNPEVYCGRVEQGRDPIETSEQLDKMDSFKETVIMGLRLNAGISEKRLRRRYGLGLSDVYGDILDSLAEDGLLVIKGGNVCLTDHGRSLANTVMAELV